MYVSMCHFNSFSLIVWEWIKWFNFCWLCGVLKGWSFYMWAFLWKSFMTKLKVLENYQCVHRHVSIDIRIFLRVYKKTLFWLALCYLCSVQSYTPLWRATQQEQMGGRDSSVLLKSYLFYYTFCYLKSLEFLCVLKVYSTKSPHTSCCLHGVREMHYGAPPLGTGCVLSQGLKRIFLQYLVTLNIFVSVSQYEN